ncbi:MAG: hypothetical protein ACR2P4_04015 [Gammaproteobacteria bacterium]
MNRHIKQISPERATENDGGELVITGGGFSGLRFLPGFALQKNGTPLRGLIYG